MYATVKPRGERMNGRTVGRMLSLRGGRRNMKRSTLHGQVAAGITKTCYHVYHDTATGMIARRSLSTFKTATCTRGRGVTLNSQRPEAIEAIEAIFYTCRKNRRSRISRVGGGRCSTVRSMMAGGASSIWSVHLVRSFGPLVRSFIRALDFRLQGRLLLYN